MYVLIYDVNAYDQYGSYFLAAWPERPTLAEIAAVLQESCRWYMQPGDLAVLQVGRPITSGDYTYKLEHYEAPKPVTKPLAAWLIEDLSPCERVGGADCTPDLCRCAGAERPCGEQPDANSPGVPALRWAGDHAHCDGE